MHIILAHENADFDAVASMLAAHKLYPDATPVLLERQNRNVARFLTVYAAGLPFVRAADIRGKRIDQVTLVDTQRLPQMRGLRKYTHVHIIDHHPVEEPIDPDHTFSGEVIGATTTLLIEQIQAQSVAITSLEATLMALGIYEDTGFLTYGTTTPRDLRAAAWLLERSAVLDIVRKFMEPPLNDVQQALFETLLTSADMRTIQGYPVIVCAARTDRYIAEVSAVAHRLRDTLDPAALFVLVEMAGTRHLVCRSSEDAINAGEIARAFGGGGHGRAAAATVRDRSYEDILTGLWGEIEKAVHPAVRVSDLMSYGVQTVDAGQPIREIVGRIRRIGHEGYPVVENGRLVGLLTRRDVERAVEHDLGQMTVRDVMAAGKVILRPADSVQMLEQVMVESGWGQIPVVDDAEHLIGIVTRTDLIKHWARTHPAEVPLPPTLSPTQMRETLGEPVTALIEAIASHAADAGINLYLVGGVVRDLILHRPNFDVDFVAEGDGIVLAHSLQARYGGQVSSFRPFGTAKWRLDDAAAAALKLDLAAVPDHIDFATARNEYYEAPTALPTVYSGSVKLDLRRRDFTINTLAVQMSPPAASGRILDFFGGLSDLEAGLLRVLHSLSFVDDPTRILRAVRFEERLNFQIEPRTAELIETALPMLRRITGERLRNELSLLLREAAPEHALLRMEARGILSAIHPAFTLEEAISADFAAARALLNPDAALPWDMAPPDPVELRWHLIACRVAPAGLEALLERLLFARSQAESMTTAARLAAGTRDDGLLRGDEVRPSRVVTLLDGVPDLALLAVWIVVSDDQVRARLAEYARTWRHIRPTSDGYTLQGLGLKPGPCYTILLNRLRAARLDGEIADDEGERRLLVTLVQEGICDDTL